MKILFACPNFKNDFIQLLKGGIAESSREAVVHVGYRFFDKSPDRYDIVHIHWEEYLVRQRYKNAKAAVARLQTLKDRGAKIVLTRHNRFSHRATSRNKWRESLLTEVYRMLDGVVHMSERSKIELLDELPGIRHEVIFHPIYSNLPNNVSRNAARSILGIPHSAKVLLVFGALRNRAERHFTTSVFEQMEIENKFLLVSGWSNHYPLLPSKLLLRLGWVRYRHNDRLMLDQFVPTEEVQLFFSSADVVLVPRLSMSNLNSGVIYLAITYGKCVVGPKQGGIGEMLNLVDCPSFQHDSLASAVQATERAFAKTADGASQDRVRSFGLSKLAPRDIGHSHAIFYSKLLGS